MRALKKLRAVFDDTDVRSTEDRLATIEGQVVRLLAAQEERDADELERSAGAQQFVDACKEMLGDVPNDEAATR